MSRLHRLLCVLGVHEWRRLEHRHRQCAVCGRREYWYAERFWMEVSRDLKTE